MKNYLQLRKLTVFILFALFVSGNMFAQTSNGKQIVYVLDAARINTVTGEHTEEPTIKFFRDNGYTVDLFPTFNLSNASQEQLDSLENADLVYMGRTIPSANLSSDDQRAKWNAITTPVMTGNQWALRNNRAKWFDSEDIGANHEEFAEIEALIETDDPVFGGLSGLVKFWTGPYNVINISAAPSTCNGTIMVGKYDDPIGVLFVRFQAYMEFYSGLNEMPMGERVFIGCASDQASDADGNVIYSYFGFTDEFKQVFLNEANRLAGVGTSVDKKFNNTEVLVYPNPVKSSLSIKMNNLSKVQILDLSGRIVTSVNSKKSEMSIDVNHLNNGVYFLKTIDANGNSITKKVTKE